MGICISTTGAERWETKVGDERETCHFALPGQENEVATWSSVRELSSPGFHYARGSLYGHPAGTRWVMNGKNTWELGKRCDGFHSGIPPAPAKRHSLKTSFNQMYVRK